MIHWRQFCASLRCIWVYILTYEYIYSRMSIYTHIFEYVYSCIWVCLSGMPPTSLHGTLGLDQVYTYIHKCIYIHISSYIPTYIHTYIHTYILIDTYIRQEGPAAWIAEGTYMYLCMYIYIRQGPVAWIAFGTNVCWRMSTYAGVCWLMPTYADECRGLLLG
jgi:hypothetical protein